MADVLLTGGSGLIGRRVLERLSGEHRLWALARTNPDADGVTWIEHDLAEQELPTSLPASIETVVHLAQSDRFRQLPQEAPHVFDVNAGSTVRLLDWARSAGAKRFVYASTGGVYGRGSRPFTENAPLPTAAVMGFYAVSKRCGELLAKTYDAHFTVVVLRFFFVYGAGQQQEMLVPRMVRSVADGTPVRLDGANGITINPTHVDDAADAVARACTLPEGATVNVAGPESLTLREMALAIGRHVGRDPVFENTGQDALDLLGDTARMSKLLVPPRIRFADGVADLCRNVIAK